MPTGDGPGRASAGLMLASLGVGHRHLSPHGVIAPASRMTFRVRALDAASRRVTLEARSVPDGVMKGKCSFVLFNYMYVLDATRMLNLSQPSHFEHTK
jgi:hypothetical protein